MELSRDDLKHIVDLNFQCADDRGVGKLTVGEFLMCFTGILCSYDMCMVRFRLLIH